MRSLLPVSSRFIPVLFFPAGLMLAVQAALTAAIAHRLLSLALALFCLELARMASVDLKNVLALSSDQLFLLEEDSRLVWFYKIVASTIVLELTGFYAALLSLPLGAAVIMTSQLWFNLLAGVQLHPGQVPAIVSFGAFDRKLILIANSVGLSLICLWPMQSARIVSASGLLGLIALFLIVKYIALPVTSS